MTDTDRERLRDSIMMAVLSGLAANPNVIAANAITGWDIVNGDWHTLGWEAYKAADAAIDARHAQLVGEVK